MSKILPFRLALTLLVLSSPAALSAQTYVGNLDGVSPQSTFEGLVQQSLQSAGIGWTKITGANVVVFDNTNNVVINLTGQGFDNFAVEYRTGVPLVANSTYTLSFTMGYVSGDYTGKANYNMWLYTYGDITSYTYLNSTSGSAVASNGGAFATTNPSGSLTASVTFTTGAVVSGDQIVVQWSSTNDGTTQFVDANYFGFDNVTLSYVSAVPEPSTYAAIFGACALGFAFWRRRQSAAP